MKLPYFYQQMLGFFAVIVTLMYISIFSFFHFTRNAAQEATQNDLFKYAETVVENIYLYQNVEREQALLNKFDINLFVANEHGDVIYPHSPELGQSTIVPEEIDQLREGQRVTSVVEYKTAENKVEEMMLVYVPFFTQSTQEFSGFVAAATPVSMVTSEIVQLETQLFHAFLIATIIAIIISALLARYQVNRINHLREAAHTVAEGEYDVRVEHGDRDELDALSRDFNKMVLALEETEKALNRQEERRKTFMQDAAHEMRTPLTTINGLLEGLEHNVIAENNRLRSIQLMRKETTRLIRLVNENVDYENIRSNHIKLNKTHISLKNIFSEIRYQMDKLADESNNQLEIAEANELTVYADYDRLKQIFVNLIKNAIQFTENGKVSVKAWKSEYGTVIEIADTGIGMSEEQLANIWERYYKADASRRNTKYGESGLGLSIVQQLITLHDARIDVTSEEGVGTTFRLEFPDSPEQAQGLNRQGKKDLIE